MLAPNTIYRFSIWLPILVPALVLVIDRTADVRLRALGILLASLLYGGVPYAVLAIGATLWSIGKQEQEIRRLMFRAPWIMAGMYGTLCLVLALVLGPAKPFIALGFLGAIASVPFGYLYIGIAVALRRMLGPPQASA